VPLGELLVRRGHVQRHELRTALARKMGYPVVDVEAFPVELAALKRVPIAAAKRLNVLPLQELPGRLVMAIEDPSRRDVIDELEFLAQCKIVPVLAVQENLASHIEAVYRKNGFEEAVPVSLGESTAILSMDEGGSSKLLADLELTPGSDRDKTDDAPIEQSDNSLVRLINTMIIEAHSQGVSDIHIEAQPGRRRCASAFAATAGSSPTLTCRTPTAAR
jgi:type II secretory ATPase GspE/PulE/Tfp pilus assembly ATPase PilB-like protein